MFSLALSIMLNSRAHSVAVTGSVRVIACNRVLGVEQRDLITHTQVTAIEEQ